MQAEAWELIEAATAEPAWVLCCEHASNRLPPPWRWPAEDSWVVETHWAYDIGAETMTRELAAATGASALIARFSRLLVDPNRPLDSPTLIRKLAEGRRLRLNHELTLTDRARRLAYWSAYHDRLGECCRHTGATVLLAIHSFTEQYEGQLRDDIEVGVLFDQAEALGIRLAERIAALGVKVKLNEPYSGKQGMIYSADRHAREHGKQAVEVEVRQDRIVDDGFRRQLVDALAAVTWVAAAQPGL